MGKEDRSFVDNFFSFLKMTISRESIPLWYQDNNNSSSSQPDNSNIDHKTIELLRFNQLVQSISKTKKQNDQQNNNKKFLSLRTILMNALIQTPLPHGLRTYIQINLKKDVIRASLRCYSSIVHQEKEYVRFTDSTIIDPPNVSFNEWATQLLLTPDNSSSSTAATAATATAATITTATRK